MTNFRAWSLLAAGLAVIAGMIYGSLRPLHKAQLLNQMIAAAPQAVTAADFKEIFNSLLSYHSPVGQEEAIYQILKLTDGALENRRFSLKEMNELLEFDDQAARPTISNSLRSHYPNTKLIFGLASLYHDAGDRYRERKFYDQAEELYKVGLTANPRRPQFLYGLFQIYLQEKRLSDTKLVGKQILKLWPSDQKTREIMAGL